MWEIYESGNISIEFLIYVLIRVCIIYSDNIYFVVIKSIMKCLYFKNINICSMVFKNIWIWYKVLVILKIFFR